MRLYDEKTYTKGNGSNEKIIKKGGKTTVGETQNNVVNVAVSQDGSIRKQEDINRSASHELGHSGGLYHPWNKKAVDDIKQNSDDKPLYKIPDKTQEKIKDNLMNSAANPSYKLESTEGTDLTKGQFNRVKKTVKKQQKD